MVLIKNTQKKIAIDKKYIKNIATTIMQLLGLQDFDLGIWFTTNKTIQFYNKRYRGKDKPTDILSFPYYQIKKPGELVITDTEEKNLGDLIISAEYVQQMCKEYDVDFQERLKILLVHGICHLLGYEHQTEAESDVMQTKEQEILATLKTEP